MTPTEAWLIEAGDRGVPLSPGERMLIAASTTAAALTALATAVLWLRFGESYYVARALSTLTNCL